MLAIVAPSFNRVSETFIADHARALAPGRTVLVCMDSVGAERFGCPVLSHLNPTYAQSGVDRALDALLRRSRRAFGYGPILARTDRMRLAEFFRTQNVTVVLGEFGNMGPLVGDVCQALCLPFYVIFRGHDATIQLRHRSLRVRHRRVFRHAAGVIAESRYLADRLVQLGCPERLLTVITSGMDPEQFRPAASELGRILHVGRLVEMKAPQVTIEAFARIAAEFPQARLDVVGDGPLRGRCEALVAARGLGGRIALHGAQDHAAVTAFTARAAIFALHSVTDRFGQTEGFPVAISEAMASALPVVSTRHSGIPEHVQDGVTGLLVDENDVEGMARALAALLADPERAAEMGRAGRRYALEHLTRRGSHRRLWEVMDLASRLAPLTAGPDVPRAEHLPRRAGVNEG
jgi:colanic acid/amylovoran biosynthesis glycosyltransferase